MEMCCMEYVRAIPKVTVSLHAYMNMWACVFYIKYFTPDPSLSFCFTIATKPWQSIPPSRPPPPPSWLLVEPRVLLNIQEGGDLFNRTVPHHPSSTPAPSHYLLLCYAAFTQHTSIDGCFIFDIPKRPFHWTVYLCIFPKRNLIGRRIHRRLTSLTFPNFLTRATEPTERTDPQCISRAAPCKVNEIRQRMDAV